ncbi:extracellular solute-binding protein [Microbacterium ulmi]|uniref:Extracellular solute-binding protein n=2 Tax=Microbacterium ulmi TaxID=179095 RepID=A0A7Y2M207_9MICO|nr:extracellular solute-binding protein [Microbacterium ulmi]
MNLTSRRRTTTILASAATLTLLAGCSATASPEEKIVLTVLNKNVNEPDKTIFIDLLDGCAEQIGVTLNQQQVPGAEIIQRILQQASSHTLPDLLEIDNPELKGIAATGALAPLSDLGIDTAGFNEAFIESATWEGEVYGLGPQVNTLGLFYNAEMLAAAGLEPPTTWDELKATAAALRQGDVYGVAFSAAASYQGTWQFLPFMWSNGGDETDLTSPEVAEAAQLWVDLVNSGGASESVVTWTQADVTDQFIAGKAAMAVSGPWQVPLLDAVDFDWGVVKIPVPEAGDPVVASFGGEVWSVPLSDSPERMAKATELLECINTPESQMELASKRYTVPTRDDLFDDYLAEYPLMEPFAETIVTARARTAKLGEGWPVAATTIYEALQLAITGQETAPNAFVVASTH